MTPAVYRFTFASTVPIHAVADSLTLALVAVDALYGEPVARAGAAHLFDPARRTCVIRGGDRAGRGLVKLFAGFVTKGLGPDAYRVERVAAPPETKGGAPRV